MSAGRIDPGAYRLPVRRLFWLPLGLSAMLVLLVMAGLVAVSWRGLERIRPIQAHLAHIARIQDLGLNMEQTLLRGLRGMPIDPREMVSLRDDVGRLAIMDGHLHTQTKIQLERILAHMEKDRSDPVEVLIQTLAEIRQVLAGEREHHELLLLAVASDTETELRLAVALLVTLPVVGGALLLLLRARIKDPLDDLGDLLGRLASRDYRPVARSSLRGSASLVQPVFRSYNELVSRLQALEQEHRAREQTLEREVRQATEALLAQNRELARSERLAAVGAVSAGLAHELRNPLAGIQMACSKLQRGLTDPSQGARIEAVINELKRLNALLTEKVESARHEPEVFTRVELSVLVGELVGLTRYQTPPGVELRADIPEGLVCLLPAAGLRQALLNLLLNAVQVMDGEGCIILAAHRQEGQLHLWVEDEGPGFPEQMLRAGIRPFATGRAGGTGLGLAMVRRFVRDHDGELELANREPHGARVTLKLPCEAAGDEGNGTHG